MPPDSKTPYQDMAIHAQALDFDELSKLDSLPADEPASTMESPLSMAPVYDGVSDTEIDMDDILPEESFSTHPSPAGSQVNGKIYRKPPISIFQTTDHTPSQPTKPDKPTLTTPATSQSVEPAARGLPSPPETPVARADRTKDDVPGRFSDVESTPPIRAAGFVGDEIPRLDPLDSDGEWTELAELGKKFSVAQTGEDPNNLGIVEEKKKKKKRKKKSKGVSPLHLSLKVLYLI